MQLNSVVLPFVLSLIVVAAHQINITKDYELEEFLCSGTQLLNDTTVKLFTNISHIIRNASFCIINTTYSLNITSSSSQQAVIQCNDSTIQPTGGFAFINIQVLTLQRLVMRGCGGDFKWLNATELKKSIMFPFELTRYHSAVTLFLHIKTLIIKEVNITHYYGFAMFAINAMNATIDHCEVSWSYYGGKPLKHKKGYGSGIFLLFANDTVLPSNTFNVSINYTIFHHNYEYYSSQSESTCLTDLKNYKNILSMVNAAGLSIFYIQNNFAVNVSVTQSNFVSNHAAAILVIHYNSVLQSQTTIINATFKDNLSSNNCPGSDLLLLFHISNDKIHYKNDKNYQLLPLTVL